MKEFIDKTATLISLARHHQLRATLDRLVTNRLDGQNSAPAASKPS
jgi:hypothetical protein